MVPKSRRLAYSTAIKRGFLRVAYSERGEATLADALDARIVAASNAIVTGQTVASTSSLDLTVAFSQPGQGAPGADGMVEIWDSLRSEYDYAVTSLQNDGTASPTDAQIYTRMLRDLVAVTEYTHDFTAIRRQIPGRLL